jgi:hypothetical protein
MLVAISRKLKIAPLYFGKPKPEQYGDTFHLPVNNQAAIKKLEPRINTKYLDKSFPVFYALLKAGLQPGVSRCWETSSQVLNEL